MIGWIGIVVFLVIPGVIALLVARCILLEYRHDRVPIILFHRLLCKADADKGVVRDDEMIWVSYDTTFVRQMEFLRDNGYTAIDFDDYVKIRSGQAKLPSKPVIITFDDGYVSNYTMGFPVLRRLGLKATIFVPPEPDDYTRGKVLDVDGFVSAEQIREMSDGGISIQSHTLTHCVLTDLDDLSAMHELTESRNLLSQITGRPVEHIAIPRAGYSRHIAGLVAAAGYKTACCNNKGSANGRSSLLALPRIVVERDMSMADFARCLAPRGAAILRIVGNIKRIPEFLGGARFAVAVRRRLYHGPLRPLFETRNLKKVVAAAGLLYVAACVLFMHHLITR